jgi:chromosome segregation ATPase
MIGTIEENIDNHREQLHLHSIRLSKIEEQDKVMRPITHDELHDTNTADINAIHTRLENHHKRITELEECYPQELASLRGRVSRLDGKWGGIPALEQQSFVTLETVTQTVNDAKDMLRREQTEWRAKEKQHRINADAQLQAQIDALKTRVDEMARGESNMERIDSKAPDLAATSMQGGEYFATIRILRDERAQAEEEAARYKEEWQQAAREREDISERWMVLQRDHEQLQKQLAEARTERDNEEADARYHKQAAKDATVLRQQAMADAEKWQRHIHSANPVTFADTVNGPQYDATICRAHGACQYPESSYHVNCGVKH